MELSNGVKLVNSKLEDEWGRPLKRCDNPSCIRQVEQGIGFCCGGCSRAFTMGPEAHCGDDTLSHTESCTKRHAERQAAIGKPVTYVLGSVVPPDPDNWVWRRFMEQK